MEFDAYIREGKLVYNFMFPMNRSFKPGDQLVVALYDDSYFVDMSYRRINPITINPSNAKVTVATRPNPKRNYWEGTITPIEAVFTFK